MHYATQQLWHARKTLFMSSDIYLINGHIDNRHVRMSRHLSSYRIHLICLWYCSLFGSLTIKVSTSMLLTWAIRWMLAPDYIYCKHLQRLSEHFVLKTLHSFKQYSYVAIPLDVSSVCGVNLAAYRYAIRKISSIHSAAWFPKIGVLSNGQFST